MSLRELLEMWPVALVVVAVPAVRIAFIVADSSFGAPQHAGDYPVRIALLPARSGDAGALAGREPVAFEWGSRGSSGTGSAIAIRKAVRVNRVEAGSATIRVSADSVLSISVRDLQRLLAGSGHGELARIIGAGGGPDRFVAFEELREQGIDVRYDSSADRVSIIA